MQKKNPGHHSRNKGKVGERELALRLEQLFQYACRRGQQYSGIGVADVVGLPGIHIECKRVNRFRMRESMAQASKDAIDGTVPIVCHRADGERWMVTCFLDDLPELTSKLFLILSSEEGMDNGDS